MKFDPKLVLDIKGTFRIPGYQRGYRWGKSEVTRLLDDIYERVENNRNNGSAGLNYCLQPVVVKEIDKTPLYELIDGQQRLTTIYLILKAIQTDLNIEVPYHIEYETRKESKIYLDSLDESRKNEYIDFRYIHDAYRYILEWFGSDTNNAMMKKWKIFGLLKEHVQVLWYEADQNEDGRELFSRLNIGKIPLTNAELVKALFLNRGTQGDAPSPLQEQIAAQWDNLERELHDKALWSFLTNADEEDYDTRLDLLFDFFTIDREEKADKYAIFFELNRQMRERQQQGDQNVTESLWRDIYEYFLRIREWFNDNGLYHRAGYLIAVNKSITIAQLLKDTEDMGYDEKITYLDNLITREVDLENPDTESGLKELSYGKNSAMIEKILLLLNVRTTAGAADMSRFPFDRYKAKKRNEGWSLEHIHAQHSAGLNKREQWVEWLRENSRGLEAIKGYVDDAGPLLDEVAMYLAKDDKGVEGYNLDQTKFESLRSRITALLSADNMTDEDIHSISNLALLGFKDNVVLSNSLFETKRQKIIGMDSQGVYVPVCTRNVFMKYYTPAGANQPHFWSRDDRDAYLNQILKVVYNISQ